MKKLILISIAILIIFFLWMAIYSGRLVLISFFAVGALIVGAMLLYDLGFFSSAKRKIMNNNFPNIKTPKMKDGHFVIELTCPNCGLKGICTYGQQEFKLLGKDEEGFICYECPKCSKHLKYDSLSGEITKK